MRNTRVLALAAVGWWLCALVAPASAATKGVQLRVAAREVSASGANLVLVVPKALSGQAKGAASFVVQQSGKPIAASVHGVADTGLAVYVVLDATDANTALAAEQSAAADLLRAIPPTVEVATVTPGAPLPTPQRGNATALRALAGVRSQSLTYLPETLSALATAPAANRRRVVVLLTNCRPETADGFKGLDRDLADQNQQLDVIAVGRGCRRGLSDQARTSGGIVIADTSSGRLAEAVDAVAADALGQYAVSVKDLVNRSPLTVTLTTPAGQATTTVPLSASRRPGKAASPPYPLALALAGISALILVATAVWAASRSSLFPGLPRRSA